MNSHFTVGFIVFPYCRYKMMAMITAYSINEIMMPKKKGWSENFIVSSESNGQKLLRDAQPGSP